MSRRRRGSRRPGVSRTSTTPNTNHARTAENAPDAHGSDQRIILAAPSSAGSTAAAPTPAPTRRIQKWQLTVAIAAVVLAAAVFWVTTALQNRRAADAVARVTANVSVQAGIQPSRSQIVQGKVVPLRWYGWYFVMNNGPATAKQFFVNIWTANPARVRSDRPTLRTTPTAADVRVVPRSMGLYQVVVSNLQPGDGFWLEQDFAPTEPEAEAINRLWPTKMFDEEFTSRFVTSIGVTGENVAGKVDGMYSFGSIP